MKLEPGFGSVDDLRTFLRIIDAGSLSGAAAVARVSVNAVSQRLSRLEARLGARLLNRTTRRLHATDEGLRFAERCRRALAELDDGARELEREERGLSGEVRLLVHPALVHTGLLGSLAELLKSHGSLRVAVRAAAVLEDAVSFDLAMWIGAVSLRSLMLRRLGELRWGLAAAPGYIKAHGAPRTPQELEGHQSLRALRSPPEREWVLHDEHGRQSTAAIDGRLESNDAEVLRQALDAGVGIGLRPLSEILRRAREGSLVHVLPGWVFDPVAISIVSPPARMKLARVKAVADTLARAARQLGTATRGAS